MIYRFSEFAPAIFLLAFALAAWNLMVRQDFIDVYPAAVVVPVRANTIAPVAAVKPRVQVSEIEATAGDLRRKLGLPDVPVR